MKKPHVQVFSDVEKNRLPVSSQGKSLLPVEVKRAGSALQQFWSSICQLTPPEVTLERTTGTHRAGDNTMLFRLRSPEAKDRRIRTITFSAFSMSITFDALRHFSEETFMQRRL